MATVQIRDVRKAYGTQKVIHGVSLSIADGEFVSLIGASGCGKSTLLRMIAGLEEIDSGTVSLGDRVINDVAPKDRDIAMVFQNYALYPHLTVADNMGFSLRLRKVSKLETRKAVEAAADLLGLGPYLDRLPRALSGGQRQRVAMGRAIVRQPQVFLFDEPLSNLDAKLRVQMRVEIKSLQKRLGTTSIYVTHDQIEAMTMSDRIVIMNGGRIEQAGAPLDVYDRPTNLFVATFIGSPAMNLLPGTLLREDGAAFIQIGETRLALAPDIDAASGTSVVCGIRPEHADLVTAQSAATGLPFTVDLVEPTGAESHLYGRLAGQSAIIALHGRARHAPGDTAFVTPKPGEIHVFHAETGFRL
ncbi:sugar ABC transporter ATP-binding protein [Aureimonas sp. SA4125]|uniref:ABC transporter ATP-binding protein n=1 Tax=Aureimonas sp. SA4125 TaxID=2826993 RepID=UPI001CC3CBD8|nr:sn-glycerol-3-phosphate ABC transporter ATP-binding protein UgpC [Aureimonas sp. SA4125]BDA84429.1 sugar ABC transporter ATP-binding protein [Aureimonas sp. SA4125]